MKKMFLGLILAGAMMSFTSKDTKTSEDGVTTCCTATYNGFSATRCVAGNNRETACSLARTYAIIASIQ